MQSLSPFHLLQILLTVTLSQLKQIASLPVGKTLEPNSELDKSPSTETLGGVIGPRMKDDGSDNLEDNLEPIDESTGQSTGNESSVNKPTTQDEEQVKTTEENKETINEESTTSTVNENKGDIKDISDVGYDGDSIDELVYAEDPLYKEYNLTLYTPDTVETSGSMSAATLITALGLPATSSFVQALLTAYSLPNGPSLVEDLLSKLLLIDDNLLVNIVQSLGKDGLQNQGLTLNEFKDFLLDDDNEALNLMMRLFTGATKGNELVNVQLDNIPLKQVDHFPNFELDNNIHDDPIIYTPFQEQISARRQPFSQRPIPQPLVFNRIIPTSHQNPHRFQPFQGQNLNPGRIYYFSPQTAYDHRMLSGPSQAVSHLQPTIRNFPNPQITNFGQRPIPTHLASVVPRGPNYAHAPWNNRLHQLTGSQYSPLQTPYSPHIPRSIQNPVHYGFQ
uniref:Uncharacterized protein n=1 Tax=Cacopsylla melanoneura TaxID=428564 RepID=A0A8D8QZH1_9HEMI